MSASDGLCITALGMVSALGRDVVTSCAAARAGLAQPSELSSLDFASEALFGQESIDERPAVHGHGIRGSGDGFAGVGKALVQGGDALDDLLRNRPLSDRERARTGLVLNVSDHFLIDLEARIKGVTSAPSVRWASLTQALPHRLAESRGLALSVGHHLLHRGGNAGGAAALEDAMTRIRRGEVDRCIVGGIDARTDAVFLKAAAGLFQLRTMDNPVGLCPGEAAAFFLVERESEAKHSSHAPLARLGGAWTVRGAADLLEEPVAPSGVALAEVVGAALAEIGTRSRGRDKPWMVGDLNGTQRRAVEWAHAQVRLRASFALAPGPAWFLATSFGDVGAASGPVGVSCAVRGWVRGYAKYESAVIWLSSESGAKGAIALERPKV